MEAVNIQLLPLFEWLVKTTIQGSVLIGLILLVKVILRGRLPIRWHYFFWLLLLIRLAAPRLPQSRFSIFNFVPESSQLGKFQILPVFWLLGALVMAGIVGVRNFTLWRTVRRERPITDQEILDLLEDCKMEMGVKTIVGVIVSDKVKSPVLFGFVRPRLLLPQGILEAYDLEELRYIFIHELAHFKQRDIYLGWLMALLQILHWFNPLMWFAFHRMRVDRELACDGLAVSRMDAHEPPRYGRTILNLFERFSQVSYVPSIAGILEDSSKLERRINMIAKFKKTSRTRSVSAVLVLMVLASITLTDAYTAPPFIFNTPTNLGPPVNRGGAVNSPDSDIWPSISTDGLELYFSSTRAGGLGNTDLWVSTRTTTDDDWGNPVNLGPIVNSSYLDVAPNISADGLELYFYSNRPGGEGDRDLWVTKRATVSDPWGIPSNLGPTINSVSWDSTPNISSDGLWLYFCSDRGGGYGSGDIWVTKRATVSDPWGIPSNLGPTVNSAYVDGGTSISANGLWLFFGSDRPGGEGYSDLYVTTRSTVYDDWVTPINLGSAVNSSYLDAGPNLSADGLSLYFHSGRPAGSGGWDLYVVTRPSVSEPFGQLQNLSGQEGGPSFSADGLELYFASNRFGGFGYSDLWVTKRTSVLDSWEEPVNLGSTVNSSSLDSGPRISADGLSLFYQSNRLGGIGNSDLYMTTRVSTEHPWSIPANLGMTVNSSNFDGGPSISGDGLSLYFYSYRPGGYGDADIWVTTRETIEHSWSQPVNLGPSINSSSFDGWPNISADGRLFIFASSRPGGSGDWDLWMMTRKAISDPWGIPINLGPVINSSHHESASSMLADNSTLYFTSHRPDGLGGFDIWQVDIAVVYKLPDFNRDGNINFKDFTYLAFSWSDSSPLIDIAPPPSGDGIVDTRELGVLSEYWLIDPNLVVYWKLDETKGIFVNDSLGNRRIGRLMGDPVWRPDGGKIDGALEFDGIDDYVSVPFVLNPRDGAFSAFAWVKGGAANEVVLSQMNGIGSGGRSWLCADPSEGKLMTGFADVLGGVPLQSEFVITDGSWCHIGFVWDGSRRYLYGDGVEVAKDTDPLFLGLESADGGMYLGASKTLDAANFWSGLIDDVRIYNRALTEEDIDILAE